MKDEATLSHKSNAFDGKNMWSDVGIWDDASVQNSTLVGT